MKFPAPTTVRANGVHLAVYEQGSGFPVVLCHGFPELAYSWRHQIGPLAAAGYRAIALDQRGYGASERPSAVEAYDIRALTGDLVGLLDALGQERAVFCGHDWGALVNWQLALLHPERVAGIIALTYPYFPRGETDVLTACRARFGDDMYMLYFQEPGRADAELAADVARTARYFFRASAGLSDGERRPFEVESLALMEDFKTPEGTWPGRFFLGEADLRRYVTAFENTGFTGALNWYRNLARNWALTEGLPERIEVPCLMISGAHDVVCGPHYTEAMVGHVPDLERHVMPDCGHWIQQEKPEETNRLICDWLRRRFPVGG